MPVPLASRPLTFLLSTFLPLHSPVTPEEEAAGADVEQGAAADGNPATVKSGAAAAFSQNLQFGVGSLIPYPTCLAALVFLFLFLVTDVQ